MKPNSHKCVSVRQIIARPVLLATAAALLAGGGGCRFTEYAIVLEPDDEGIERTVEVHERSGDALGPPSEDTLERLATIYGVPGERMGTGGVRFSGPFVERMPEDLHGAGRYVILDSPLGTAYGYVERFGGEPDLLTRIEGTREASDTLAKVVRAWFERELHENESWPTLATFLETRFPRDLANVSLYWWIGEAAAGPGDDPGAFEALSAQVFLYLVETGYLRPKELPDWLHILENLEEDPSFSLQPVQRLIARLMGVPDEEPVPESLDFLAERDGAIRSWNEFAHTPAFAEALGRKTIEDPGDAMEDLLLSQWLGIDFGQDDRFNVTLRSGAEPAWTNGHWEPETNEVVWSTRLLPADRRMPALAYAVWADPDEDAQRDIVGQVVLQGDSLVKYSLWYRGLPSETRTAWDESLQRLDPAAPILPQLEALPPSDAGDWGRRLLIEAMSPPGS